MARTKVLVVDDSPSVRQQVGMALSLAGFDIVEAVDGLDGAQKIETVAGLSLVVCDVNMPRLNGVEMVEKVKAGGKNAVADLIHAALDPRIDLSRDASGRRGLTGVDLQAVGTSTAGRTYESRGTMPAGVS